MSIISDELEYKTICFKIKKGIATDKNYVRLNLVEARITAVFLQQKLEKEYSINLVNEINSLDIRIKNMERSWEIYNTTRSYHRA